MPFIIEVAHLELRQLYLAMCCLHEGCCSQSGAHCDLNQNEAEAVREGNVTKRLHASHYAVKMAQANECFANFTYCMYATAAVVMTTTSLSPQ